MRVLCEPARLRPLLTAEGHQLGGWRPEVGVLSFSAGQLPRALSLRAPYLAWAEAAPRAEHRVAQASLTTLGAGAEALLCPSGALGEALADRYRLPRVELIEPGLDLNEAPLGPRAEALAVLGAPPRQRFAACLSELAEAEQLAPLALAQREVPGLGLLITGMGPQRSRVRAMELATRPSSPVIHLGPSTPATRVLAACACTIGVDVSPSQAGARLLAAQGRRLVVLDGPELPRLQALYPPLLCPLFVARPEPRSLRHAIQQALDAEERLGPLPPDTVTAARQQLDADKLGARLSARLQRVGQPAPRT